MEVVFSLSIVWVWVFFKVLIGQQYVPTAISGIASSTGLIVGFSATIFGLTFSKFQRKEEKEKHVLGEYIEPYAGFKEILGFVLLTMGSIFLLSITYLLLGLNTPDLPFKFGITSLLVALIGFTFIIISVARNAQVYYTMEKFEQEISDPA